MSALDITPIYRKSGSLLAPALKSSLYLIHHTVQIASTTTLFLLMQIPYRFTSYISKNSSAQDKISRNSWYASKSSTACPASGLQARIRPRFAQNVALIPSIWAFFEPLRRKLFREFIIWILNPGLGGMVCCVVFWPGWILAGGLWFGWVILALCSCNGTG